MQVRSFSDTEFAGINDISGDIKLRSNNIVSCANVDLTDNREAKTRRGYSQALALPGITAAYFTEDRQDLFVIAAGELLRVFPDFTTVSIATGLDGSRVYWSELGNRIGLSGSVCGMIRMDENKFVAYPLTRPAVPVVKAVQGSRPAGDYIVSVVEVVNGEHTPASPSTFVTLQDNQAIQVDVALSSGADTAIIFVTESDGSVMYGQLIVNESGRYVLDSNPFAGQVLDEGILNSTGLPGYNGPCAFFNSRWHVAYYDEASSATYIYESAVFRFGLFDLVRGFTPIPGEVTMMAAVDDGIIVGSNKGVWIIPGEGQLRRLTPAPVPKHASFVKDRDGVLWFWTREGLAKAMPFEEVTVDRLDPDSASEVSLGLVEDTRGDQIVVITRI